MQILTGNIQSITSDSKYIKKTVTLKMQGKQVAFIEFRGPIMVKMLSQVEPNELVQIPVSFNGRVSPKSGQEYNNLVAKGIKKL